MPQPASHCGARLATPDTTTTRTVHTAAPPSETGYLFQTQQTCKHTPQACSSLVAGPLLPWPLLLLPAQACKGKLLPACQGLTARSHSLAAFTRGAAGRTTVTRRDDALWYNVQPTHHMAEPAGIQQKLTAARLAAGGVTSTERHDAALPQHGAVAQSNFQPTNPHWLHLPLHTSRARRGLICCHCCCCRRQRFAKPAELLPSKTTLRPRGPHQSHDDDVSHQVTQGCHLM